MAEARESVLFFGLSMKMENKRITAESGLAGRVGHRPFRLFVPTH